MSAWRGEARNTSAPKRARSLRGEPITEIISIAQQARPKPSGTDGVRARPVLGLLERGEAARAPRRTARGRRRSMSPRSICLARELADAQVAWRSVVRASPPFEGPPSPHEHERRRAAARRTRSSRTSANVPNVFSCTRDRVEEDHLDVEEDEQHRDQVEADPEAEVLRDLRGQPALVGLALDRLGRLGPSTDVRKVNSGADAAPRNRKTRAGK